jgi:hypothetical protein
MSGVFRNIDPPPLKVRTYKEYHSVRPSSELGLGVFPSPPETGGRGHTSLRVGGWGESQFRRGAYTVVLFICTYFVPHPLTPGECVPPSFGGGREDILAGWRGGGGSIVGKTPDTALYSINVITFCSELIHRGR